MRESRSTMGDVAGVMGGVAIRIILLTLAALATIVSVKYCYDFGRDVFYQEAAEAAPGRDIDIEIRQGDDIGDIAGRLYEEGLIRNRQAFEIQGKLYKIRLYPGVYRLNTSMTSKQLMDAINITEEEYESRNAESAGAGGSDADVYGEASDLVDEEQASAAAAEGIRVEID